MSTIPRRNSGFRGSIGGGTPRGPRHSSGGGVLSSSSFGPSRDQIGSSTSRSTGAWGTGGVGSNRLSERSAPTMPVGDAYKVACRDRFINLTSTMMGERAEVTTVNGCVYDGVLCVLTPRDPEPSGTRGCYKVCVRPLSMSINLGCDTNWSNVISAGISMFHLVLR